MPDSERQERGGDYERILTEIDYVLAADNPEVTRRFVEGRLHSLKREGEPKEFSVFSEGATNAFLHPEAEVKRSMIVDGFHVDDDDLYYLFLKELRERKNHPVAKGVPIRAHIPTAMLGTIGKYFGNLMATSSTEARSREFYMDHSSVDSESIHLREFRDLQIGVCAEKAAAVQNLARFVGMDTWFVMSPSCKLTPESKGSDFHAYNVFKTDKGAFITDFTNPHMAKNVEGRVVSVQSPAIYPITGEQFSALMAGGQVEVQHRDIVVDAEGKRTHDDFSSRVYGGPRKN